MRSWELAVEIPSLRKQEARSKIPDELIEMLYKGYSVVI